MMFVTVVQSRSAMRLKSATSTCSLHRYPVSVCTSIIISSSWCWWLLGRLSASGRVGSAARRAQRSQTSSWENWSDVFTGRSTSLRPTVTTSPRRYTSPPHRWPTASCSVNTFIFMHRIFDRTTNIVASWVKPKEGHKAAERCSCKPDSCSFLTKSIASAQSFNFASNFFQNKGFVASLFKFFGLKWEKNSGMLKCGRIAATPLTSVIPHWNSQ